MTENAFQQSCTVSDEGSDQMDTQRLAGICKALEVAAGIALPRDAKIEVFREDDPPKDGGSGA